MAARTRLVVDDESNAVEQRPDLSVCESSPGTAVFLESGNTDGWIASDTTVDVSQ